MKVLTAAIALAIALASGCAHVPAPCTLEEVNAYIDGSNGSIVFTGGSVVSGKAICVSEAFVTWTNPHTGSAESVPTPTVEEIRIPRRGRGAWRGFGRGCLVGCLVGALLGPSVVHIDDPENWFTDRDERVMKAVIGGVGYGAIAGSVGAVWGIVAGKDVYSIRRLSESPLEGADASDEQ